MRVKGAKKFALKIISLTNLHVESARKHYHPPPQVKMCRLSVKYRVSCLHGKNCVDYYTDPQFGGLPFPFNDLNFREIYLQKSRGRRPKRRGRRKEILLFILTILCSSIICTRTNWLNCRTLTDKQWVHI